MYIKIKYDFLGTNLTYLTSNKHPKVLCEIVG